jgi:hypothetical protein
MKTVKYAMALAAALAGLVAPAVKADTYTISTLDKGAGTSISQLDIDAAGLDVSFQTTNGTLGLQLMRELRAGKEIPTLFIDDFDTVGGITKLLKTFEFGDDFIAKDTVSISPAGVPTYAITFTYEKMETLTPTATAEPSAPLLLGIDSILFGAIAMAMSRRRKRLA